ncbi:MAG: winged helix-turn-helix transcriptional regulator [Clostridia bacterium]|nr:winged helix-turn-helix transcriptional regulator [Clostridia bacterium]
MEHCLTKQHDKIREKLLGSDSYNKSVEKTSLIFSLLGEPSRMKIVLALMEGELCVYHICEITGGKQSATSQHLRKLKDNHIVKARKEANQVLYSIADEHITTIIKMAIAHQDCE